MMEEVVKEVGSFINPNVQNNKGHTILHIAVMVDRRDIVDKIKSYEFKEKLKMDIYDNERK
eukprot:CAMPEP_0202964232 /NCGR_PEP_ID=MMETSP1396-20130829/8307_1 /ASSEMBLY_ACC=CAM_ASM_000872 /TAXON_ID= /ORGANISM="Pseudokeronopsis sp., Strain Brazil" /LENGTH=60 /DNA_ID=CAMNT_0049686167 /DNA_START=479 /DNA_END=661 /DNA_ORIENTATION=+